MQLRFVRSEDWVSDDECRIIKKLQFRDSNEDEWAYVPEIDEDELELVFRG